MSARQICNVAEIVATTLPGVSRTPRSQAPTSRLLPPASCLYKSLTLLHCRLTPAGGRTYVRERLLPPRQRAAYLVLLTLSGDGKMDLQGKVALVTGAATGIGLAYVKIMLENGLKHAAILDVNQTAGEEAVKNLNEKFGPDSAIFIACDATKPEELEEAYKKTVKTFKKLHIVINNAGIMRDSVWELEINLNFTTLVRSTFIALDYIGKDKGGEGGAVVNIASIAGFLPASSLPVYTATKRAVIAFSQSMGDSFHENRTGVRILTLCPGVTDTPLISDSHLYLKDKAWTDELATLLKKLPAQKPESVAAAMLHILKNAKSGSVWIAEGGEPTYEVKLPHYVSLKA